MNFRRAVIWRHFCDMLVRISGRWMSQTESGAGAVITADVTASWPLTGREE
ncbi:MAG: hypothetical protein ACOCW2_03235 [Chitinivibrionales bacterium]